MRCLRVLPEAEEELAEAAEWYEAKRQGLGVELVLHVQHAFDEILQAPETSPLWQAARPYRKLAMRRFPYVIMFTVDDETVEVLAVAHTKRRPGYLGGSEVGAADRQTRPTASRQGSSCAGVTARSSRRARAGHN